MPSSRNMNSQITNSSFSTIAGIGLVKIAPNITLNSILHVPKLPCNLLSISKITKDLNCLIQFSQDTCLFQDHLGKTIGSAKGSGRLYYFEDFGVQKQALNSVCDFSSLIDSQKIML